MGKKKARNKKPTSLKKPGAGSHAIPSKTFSPRREPGRAHWAYFGAIALVLVALWGLFRDTGEVIEYDLTQPDLSDWHAVSQIEIKHARGSMSLRSMRTVAGIFGPHDGSLRSVFWRQFPFIELMYVPAAEERAMTFSWQPRDRFLAYMNSQVILPPGTGRLLLDVRAPSPSSHDVVPWTHAYLEKTPIGDKLFILLPPHTELQIQKIILRESLSAFDLIRMAARHFFQTERFVARSINLHANSPILGTSSVAVFGALALLAALLVMVYCRRTTILVLFFVVASGFMLHDIRMDYRLLNHWQKSLDSSAWVADKYAEYESRFGGEFASLSKALEDHVPYQSKVIFLYPSLFRDREISFPSVLYDGLYQVSSDNAYRGRSSFNQGMGILKAYDYVFYYHPQAYLHDEKRGRLSARQGYGNPDAFLAVETLAEVSPLAKILRVIHD